MNPQAHLKAVGVKCNPKQHSKDVKINTKGQNTGPLGGTYTGYIQIVLPRFLKQNIKTKV